MKTCQVLTLEVHKLFVVEKVKTLSEKSVKTKRTFLL
jgi:hypothetical protein